MKSSLQNHWMRAIVITTACMFVMIGCSSFNHDWRVTAKRDFNDPIEGRWEGTWKSDANSHSDKLRCLLTRTAEGEYEAQFRANYKTILHFSYTAHFKGTNNEETFAFSGTADLGKLAGGVYHYDGRISATNFTSTYRSKYDHGTFQLTRPR